MVLELASLPLWAYLVWRADVIARLPKLFLAALSLLVLYPLLQCLPLPTSLWQWLPGREMYSSALLLTDAVSAMRPLSIVPQASFAAWLSLLPPLAVLLVTVNLREEALKRVMYVFLGMATFQAILALLQFGGGSQTAFRLTPTDFGEGVGTYVNRNHLAGLLEMALPISLGLLAASVGRKRSSSRYVRNGFFAKLGYALSHPPRVNAAMIFSTVSIAILLGVVFSRSRTGIGLAMVGIVLSALLYGRYIGGSRSKSLTTLFGVIGIALALVIGLAPVLERFSVDGALEDSRWTIFATSFKGAMTFFPFGSGLGTFPDVYWRFQPDSIGLFVNHAHNDYIEYLFEAGMVGMAVMIALLLIYALRWPSLLRHQHWSKLTFMQVGAGIGLFVMALHGLTDYNLHIPANAIYFAFLAGVFFHRSAGRRTDRGEEGYSTTTLQVGSPAIVDPILPAAPRVVIPNPFSE